MEAVHAEGEADGGKAAAEAAEQLVVAAAAADGGTEGGVVDVEHGAGVVADVAHQAEVEDQPRGDLGLEQLVQAAQPGDGRLGLVGGVGEHLGAATALGDLRQQLGGLAGDAGLVRAPRRARRSPAGRAPRAGPGGSSGHSEALHQGREQGRVAEPHAVVLQPGGVEGVAEDRERLGGALGSGGADQLDAGLQQLAGLAALGADAAVAVGEVAEAQRGLAGAVAGGDHAGDRDGHVRAQDEHGARSRRRRDRWAGLRPCRRGRGRTRTRGRGCRSRRSGGARRRPGGCP